MHIFMGKVLNFPHNLFAVIKVVYYSLRGSSLPRRNTSSIKCLLLFKMNKIHIRLGFCCRRYVFLRCVTNNDNYLGISIWNLVFSINQCGDVCPLGCVISIGSSKKIKTGYTSVATQNHVAAIFFCPYCDIVKKPVLLYRGTYLSDFIIIRCRENIPFIRGYIQKFSRN